MRSAIYVAAALGLCALAPALARELLVSAASVLLEGLPYLAASAVLAPRLGRWAPRLLAYLGCGCTPGPGARSIPAAIACAVLFGPWIALGRVALGTALARLGPDGGRSGHGGEALPGELVRLLPAALGAAALLAAAPELDLGHRPPALQLVAGLAIGLGAGPCALGTVALAAALRTASPLAAYALLAAGGMLDVRAWLRRPHEHGHGGRAAYLLLGLACGLAALGGGATLVHPRLVPALALSGIACLWWALRARDVEHRPAAWLAAALAAAVVIGAPAPTYRADETTLADAFAGERVDFTGAYRVQRPHAALVRYAITCCRADAHPIAALLAHPLPLRAGAWVRVRGTLERSGDALVLVPQHVRTIAPPHDPFVYE
ncbi:MAG: hypothetical protein KGN02_04165 [bacterium]|nr:hypothetical protein [bacterium]